ncbi:decarboxylating 6-phosphogluconate dehydrogenase [Candidatus Gottesmanbacteria bacterium]|nr:decarboxylating 6-phosphogluconate dehydrogenase [Candidatus Gottesmanbacteria bacterium]
MKLGFIGLGRMGKAMVLRLLEQGVNVVVYNRTKEKVDEFFAETQNSGKLYKAYEIKTLIEQLEKPRIIWLMVPHGIPVDEMISKLLEAGVEKGDIIIDGGNSFYKDSIRHFESLKKSGIHFLDIGTSGGLEGARNGACMMVGGDEEVYKKVEPILKKSAVPDGVAYFGPSGAGHFVKMVHNGVEYGMLQSIGEGFDILYNSKYSFDLHKIAFNWTKGSVVRGWLMELLEKALKQDPKLDLLEGVAGGGETGGWTVEVGKELGVETPVIEESLKARKKSIDRPTFSGKVVAALRNQFGGHEVVKK